jgi:pimeloyl-ACP methyl ester carboxylesterase
VKFVQVSVLAMLTGAGFSLAHSAPHELQTPTILHGRSIVQTRSPPASQVRHAAVANVAAAPRALSQNVIPAICPEDWAVCGYVLVPLDRKHPQGTKIAIYFEQYLHSNPGPAESAILANFGGPGLSTTTLERDFAQFLFAPNLDVHDLVLIDDRGTGLSGTLDCEELQHGTAGFAQSEIDCAKQLGASASRYGTGDVAEDVEAVRAALGYDQVDYFGASNGGLDASAYASRYGQHLRSVVLDAPVGTPALVEFIRLQFRTHSDPRMVRLVCARSLNCAADHPSADMEFSQLIQTIQRHPIEGDTFDASGNPTHVRVDEDALLNFVVTYPTGVFTSTGEILAAAAALKHGDNVPLLRLAAEGSFTLIGDSGDPTFSSAGAFLATGCVDAGQPWDWSDSVSDRKESYAEAIRDLPTNYFAPFSKSAPTGILFSTLGKDCLWWQEPTPPTPVVPTHASYPPAPTLVLDGDIDNRVPLEETTQVAALFPNSTHVVVAESGHETISTQCGQTLVANFIETLHVGDTRCAQTPELVFPAVGRFPVFVNDALAAKIDPNRVNQINSAERKVATVAVATAIDALQRSYIGAGTGVGLRGGTFQTDYGNGSGVWTANLSNCAFSTDVIVNGTVIWGADNSIVADLTVSGTGTAGGTLHVEGFWLVPGAVGNFRVTGRLGGKRVAVLVPEA